MSPRTAAGRGPRTSGGAVRRSSSRHAVQAVSEIIAEGIITAVTNVGVQVPVVVRLEGTNAPKARDMLKNSGLTITAAADLTDAARTVVALAAKGRA